MSVTVTGNGAAGVMTTPHGWRDAPLEDAARREVEQIAQQGHHPGRYLFHDGDGENRRLAAALVGKSLGRDVYRVDLSRIVSKYIGETEKNLDRVFAQADETGAILFFDEADALFGKRSEVKDSHDRYANQEVSYFLQRIEDYPGIVILATNLRPHTDDAFARRFQAIVNFAKPPEPSACHC